MNIQAMLKRRDELKAAKEAEERYFASAVAIVEAIPERVNGKPSLEECAAAFSRIVDLLEAEVEEESSWRFTRNGESGPIEQASDIAAGFWRDIRVNLEREKIAAEEAAKLKPCPADCGKETPGGTLCPLCDLLER